MEYVCMLMYHIEGKGKTMCGFSTGKNGNSENIVYQDKGLSDFLGFSKVKLGGRDITYRQI